MSIDTSNGKVIQKGFSMIEVLITILVLAIGLLGIASLQTTGMRLVHDGEKLSQATMYASSMADKMRGNASGNDYAGIDGGDRSCNEDDAEVECSVAQEDIFAWNDEIAQALPSGSGQITSDGTTFFIQVSWAESADSTVGADDDGNSIRSYTLPVRM